MEQDYYQNYRNLPDEDIIKRLNEKQKELRAVFERIKIIIENSIKIAILGCADKRLVEGHKNIFEKLLGKTVISYTFDIETEHLEGEENVIKHDCTLELPQGPFNIIYSHVLLKFIETEKQWNVIMNSHKALKEGGIAIHILDEEDYNPNVKLKNYYKVNLGALKKKLTEKKIDYFEMPIKYGLALVIKK